MTSVNSNYNNETAKISSRTHRFEVFPQLTEMCSSFTALHRLQLGFVQVNLHYYYINSS